MWKPLLASTLLFIATAQEPQVTTYTLKTNQVLTGEVQSIEGNKVMLKVSMFGGTAEISRKLDDFTPDSAYRILASQAKDTYDDDMRLAKFAADNALFESARNRLRAAYALAATAKDEAKQTEVMTTAADYVEKFFRASVAKRDFTNAKKMLNILVVRLADTRTEAQRAELVKLLDDAQEKAREERKAAEDARAEKNRDDDRVRLLKPIEAKIKEGNQDNSEGLVAKNGGTARQNYDQAIQCYIEAYKALTALQKSKADDKILQERISTIIPDLYSDGIETCMNAASLLMTKTNFNGALEYVNKALKVDPKNEQALDMRSQIQQAAATSGNRFWW